jgi:hypothetical protein
MVCHNNDQKKVRDHHNSSSSISSDTRKSSMANWCEEMMQQMQAQMTAAFL